MADNSRVKFFLTTGEPFYVSPEDCDLAARFRWRNVKGYAGRAVWSKGKRKHVRLHRLIAERMGFEPSEFVDHRDRNRLNNVRSNLRSCTLALNNANRTQNPNTRSGYRGVYFRADKSTRPWQVRLRDELGIIRSLGYFANREDAAKVYDKAAKAKYGEFAVLNFPDD